jgi:hypothetical protein
MKDWSDRVLNDGPVVVTKGVLHQLGFQYAVGDGMYHNGALAFIEEYPSFLRAGTPVQHKTA